MKMLTDLPAWAGMAILLLVDAIVLALARAHDQRQFWRMLHCERQRMSDWAEQRADQLAEGKFIEKMNEEYTRRANAEFAEKIPNGK